MSGIEVVGIVLGAYPVLLSTAKDLRDVFKDAKTWWRFEREFENFLSAVETEHIKYSLNLEILLEDLDIPEERKESLQIDATGLGWHDVQTQTELRRRIQDRYYSWFMRQLFAMNRALGDLQRLLPIVEGKVFTCFCTRSLRVRKSCSNLFQDHYMNLSVLEKEMLRLRTCFTHQKDGLLDEVRGCNNEIFAFLERASHLSGARTAHPPLHPRKQTAPLLSLQSDASDLYEIFQKHLRCNCISGHCCGITVSRTDGSRDQATVGHLKMLFWDGLSRLQVEVVSIPAPENKTIAPAGPATDKLEDVSSLHQHLSAKNRLKAVHKRAPKALFALVASSIPTFGSFPFGKSREDSAKKQDEPKRLWRVLRPSSMSKRYVAMVYYQFLSCGCCQLFTCCLLRQNAERQRVEDSCEVHLGVGAAYTDIH